MKPTKAQREILAEMARAGIPLTYHGGTCRVGDLVTTVPLRWALLEAGWVLPVDGALLVYNTPLALTEAGRSAAS